MHGFNKTLYLIPWSAKPSSGGYDKEERAAKAYDLAALKYWGPTTHINFPVSNFGFSWSSFHFYCSLKVNAICFQFNFLMLLFRSAPMRKSWKRWRPWQGKNLWPTWGGINPLYLFNWIPFWTIIIFFFLCFFVWTSTLWFLCMSPGKAVGFQEELQCTEEWQGMAENQL